MEANPNGGYLNKSQYGQDSWYGKLVITPELLAQAQATGAITVQVKDIQTTQYGECRRVTAKPYTPNAAARPQGQAPQQGYGQAPQAPAHASQDAYNAPAYPNAATPQYGHQPHAGQGQPQPAPMQNMTDEIPF